MGIDCTRYTIDRATSEITLSALELSDGEPSWPGFCTSICEKLTCLMSSPYTVSADMKLISHTGLDGHLGMMYNVKNVENFDYVYLR